MSLKLGRAIRWDPDKEQVIGDKEAAAMCVRPYRAPWDKALREVCDQRLIALCDSVFRPTTRAITAVISCAHASASRARSMLCVRSRMKPTAWGLA